MGGRSGAHLDCLDDLFLLTLDLVLLVIQLYPHTQSAPARTPPSERADHIKGRASLGLLRDGKSCVVVFRVGEGERRCGGRSSGGEVLELLRLPLLSLVHSTHAVASFGEVQRRTKRERMEMTGWAQTTTAMKTPRRQTLIRLWPTVRRTYTTLPSAPRPPKPSRAVPVDSLCIPLSPPYSIASFIPNPTPLSREYLIKLHRLAALRPPDTEEGWAKLDELGGLVAIMEGVRLVDTSALDEHMHEDDGMLVDGRVRERGAAVEEPEGGRAREGEMDLLGLAEVTVEAGGGKYYVVKTPEGIRGKKRGRTVKQEDE